MNFKEAIKSKTFNYIVSNLEISSALGKDNLYSSSWFGIDNINDLQANLDLQEGFLKQICADERKATQKDVIKNKLHNINDLRPTFKYIEKENDITLDDVQLFEIKNFCLLCAEIAKLCKDFALKIEDFPNLDMVISILDPNNEKLPSFHIYDSYSNNLKQLRKELKIELEKSTEGESELSVSLREQCADEEYKIRCNLTTEIAQFTKQLHKTAYLIGIWDVLIAKTELSKKWNLTKAAIGDSQVYTQLFNPMLRDFCELNSKRYQAIDIQLHKGICLLTGANMSGKTVLLKTLYLAQIMLQFGFFVPAKAAVMPIVDDVYLLSEDEQCELKGLSSFGSEMLNLDKILDAVEKGEKLAIYIDELARTTNPDEGKAIVCAAIEFLDNDNVIGVISTHYDNIFTAKRRLRIKGFISAESREGKPCSINIHNIQEYIDYGVVELKDDEKVPIEALNIASILGVNSKFLTKANKILSLQLGKTLSRNKEKK